MENLVKAAQALLTYIEKENVYDQSYDDGNGYIGSSQSHTFIELTTNLQQAIDTSTGPGNVETIQKLAKKGLLNAMGKTKDALEKAIQSLQQ